jgi:flagellin-like protein
MTDYNNDEGVSPVVGVILMVAVTVILAAVIGAFVLDLGGNTQENVNAGVSMNETNNGVEVQWIDRGNADQLEVLVNGSKVSGADLTSVGDSVTVTAGADDTVSVRAVSGDTENVIQNEKTETDTTGASNSPEVVNEGSPKATISITGNSPSSPSVGEIVTTTYDITNQSSSQSMVASVELVIDGSVVDSRSTSLSAGETKTNSFDWSSGTDGDVTVTVRTDDSSDSATVTVESGGGGGGGAP